MKKTYFFIATLMLTMLCLVGCGSNKSNDSEDYDYEEEYIPLSIEDEIYSYHDDYAVFAGDYTFKGKKIWAIFLRDEEMIVFVNSNNIHEYVELALRYEYEIRDNKLRFYNGYERVSVVKNIHYPETSAEIYSDKTGVSFYNMKRYGNRTNVHISATLTDEYLPDDLLAFVKKYAHY